jgi:UPF0042 nucleotide-binding protein
VTPPPSPPARARSRPRPPFVVVTGLSGSGKSQAIRALEDLGYFCVDNLPIMLIPTLAQLSLRPGRDLPGCDRRGRPRADVPGAVPEGAQVAPAHAPLNLALIFLEASDTALVRRFSETRRPHPLAPDHPSSTASGRSACLKTIRSMADGIVDPRIHGARAARIFMAVSRGRTARSSLVVTLVSFGFKHGIPVESDLVFVSAACRTRISCASCGTAPESTARSPRS